MPALTSIAPLVAGLAKARGEDLQPVYLVSGDLVLAEPAARQLAVALAAVTGCEVRERRRPPSLRPLIEDLRTFSMFEAGKVLLVVNSALLADRSAAAALVDEAAQGVPDEGAVAGGELPARQRLAASRLLQVLRLFELDPHRGSAQAVLAELPVWVLEGAKGDGRRARSKKKVDELRQDLARLLESARETDLVGFAEDPLTDLSAILQEGLPPGHCLVLAERAVAQGHPLVARLEERGAVVRLGQVSASRKGDWEGLDLLAEQLCRETGVSIAHDAMAELARRTLRKSSDRKAQDEVEADSTARLAGEFRKLASLVGQEGGGGRIDRRLVVDTVLDRGEEDVWQLLDAIGAGRADQALSRLRRMMSSADDVLATRLSFFSLLAGFCRQLTAVRGMLRIARIPAGERNYPRFKDRLAPALQQELPGGVKNPLAGLHPYRLHRAYLAACRLPEERLDELPWKVLETELLLKGESRDADAALSQLIVRLAGR